MLTQKCKNDNSILCDHLLELDVAPLEPISGFEQCCRLITLFLFTSIYMNANNRMFGLDSTAIVWNMVWVENQCGCFNKHVWYVIQNLFFLNFWHQRQSGICVASTLLPKVSMWLYLGIYGPCTLVVELSNPISYHANRLFKLKSRCKVIGGQRGKQYKNHE